MLVHSVPASSGRAGMAWELPLGLPSAAGAPLLYLPPMAGQEWPGNSLWVPHQWQEPHYSVPASSGRTGMAWELPVGPPSAARAPLLVSLLLPPGGTLLGA